MKTCIIAGCGKPAAGHSTLCANHAKTKSRHGHPLQTSIRRPEVLPYERAIRAWLDKRASPDAWSILSDLWDAMASRARIYSERVGHGRPYQRHTLQAGETIIAIDKAGKQREAIIRLLALGYLHRDNPRRFKSDDAFHFQCARQLRSLTDVSVGIYWDNERQTTKRVHRDVPPRTLKALWAMIRETGFVTYGEQIGVADRKERELRKHRPQSVIRALLGPTAADSAAEGLQP